MLQSESDKVFIFELDGLCGVLFRGDVVCFWRRHGVECDLNWVGVYQALKDPFPIWVGFRVMV